MKQECGDCRALVENTSASYRTCDEYCSQVGLLCIAAFHAINETCSTSEAIGCDEEFLGSDGICECFSNPKVIPDIVI